MLSYTRLMAHSPTEYGRMTNSLGQVIVFVEHPFSGDEAPIICVCHELQLADHSNFFDTEDMMAEHREYEPTFVNSDLLIGGHND